MYIQYEKFKIIYKVNL